VSEIRVRPAPLESVGLPFEWYGNLSSASDHSSEQQQSNVQDSGKRNATCTPGSKHLPPIALVVSLSARFALRTSLKSKIMKIMPLSVIRTLIPLRSVVGMAWVAVTMPAFKLWFILCWKEEIELLSLNQRYKCRGVALLSCFTIPLSR
jgi:hypothetical protein